jgi:hypothetical protein
MWQLADPVMVRHRLSRRGQRASSTQGEVMIKSDRPAGAFQEANIPVQTRLAAVVT